MLRFEDIIDKRPLLENLEHEIDGDVEPFLRLVEQRFNKELVNDDEIDDSVNFILSDFKGELIQDLYQIEDFDNEKRAKVWKIFEAIEDICSQRKKDRWADAVRAL
jgi:hypothetical protein